MWGKIGNKKCKCFVIFFGLLGKLIMSVCFFWIEMFWFNIVNGVFFKLSWCKFLLILGMICFVICKVVFGVWFCLFNFVLFVVKIKL